MIFAIIDYARYKRRVGPYSDNSIKSKGGRLAVPESFPMLQQLGPQHMFIYHRRDSFMSWLVMYFTGSVWSHVGIFTECGNIIDVTTKYGVIEHPLSDYFDNKSYLVIRELNEGTYTNENLTKMLEWGRNQIGHVKFSWMGVIAKGFLIVLGRHPSYKIRISADVFILLLTISPLALLSHTLGASLVFI